MVCLEYRDPEACQDLLDSRVPLLREYLSWTTATHQGCSAALAPSTADLALEDRRAFRDPGVTRARRVIKDLLDRGDETGIRGHLVHEGSRVQRAYLVCRDLGDRWDQKDHRDRRVNQEWAFQDLPVPRAVCIPYHGIATSTLVAVVCHTCQDKRVTKETGDLLDRRDHLEEWAPRASLAWTESLGCLDRKGTAENPVLFTTRNSKGRLSFWRRARKANVAVEDAGAHLDLREPSSTSTAIWLPRDRLDPKASPENRSKEARVSPASRDHQVWAHSWERMVLHT